VLVRLIRHIGMDRNPLRRTVDRVEAWITALLVAMFLLGGPLVAWGAATAVEQTALHTARVLQQERTRVGAVLLEAAEQRYDPTGQTWLRQTSVPARWQAPDGTPRQGIIVVDAPRAAGSTVSVWIDTDGRRMPPPPTAQDASVKAVVLGFAAVVVLAAFLTLLHVAVRRRLDHRRLETWQLDWILVEPRWSGRR
jgi:hypothetical protein